MTSATVPAVASSVSIDLLPSILHSEEAQCPDDDWTGLRDRAERRKRQNRLNVRAHRRKKATEAREREDVQLSETQSPFSNMLASTSGQHLQVLQWTPPTTSTKEKAGKRSHQSKEPQREQQPVLSSTRRPEPRSRSRYKPPSRVPPYYQDPSRWFPLYRDHLIPLVYYNVFRATITKIHILSLTCLLESPCTPNLQTTPLFPAPSSIPPSLRPTTLQTSTPHESWIDIFPSGAMRDNAIRHRDTFDHRELCLDLVGCQANALPREQPGIIAWTDPWHPDGWEVTEKFVDKWRFLLRGCEDVMRATNRWRAMRDEEPLVWELE
ncbi:hypothetical protein C8035_v002376 [Colletotrichum spinosum]|uniref:BZIP domain-containing protein n=1 Tax=Colletotrichum spinosum TaxID=1347390 RepID=A0A4R8Q1H5_9PEZI|nr:hypothetical protein C8035_v002376 [Colletotrichum spinosum]